MKNVLAFCFILILHSAAFAQSDGRYLPSEPRYIEVVGSAETELNPNEITVSITLREYEENKTKVSLESLDKDFQEAVSKSRIEEQHISISSMSMSAITQKRRDRDSFASKTYLIKFSTSESLLNFMKNLKDVVIENLYIAEYNHTEIEKYRLELKVQALKAAERKAEQLLGAVGARKGKPLMIVEVETNSYNYKQQSPYSNTVYEADFNVPPMEESTYNVKKIKLRFEIKARFEIE